MKQTSESIDEILRKIVGIDNSPISILCKIISVDENEMTCVVKPIDEGVNYMDVRLMADPVDDGIYYKPAVGSVVMISPQTESIYYVSMYSSIETIWLRGNQYDGLVKVVDLITKLNNLENKLNDLITACSSQVVTLAPSGTFPLASYFASVSPLTPTVQNEIENPNVLHG